jgi:Family of unknown function (DUF6058)
VLTPNDVAYIENGFRRLEELRAERSMSPIDLRDLRDRRLLPHPTYVLDDGSEMVPEDYFDLLDAATDPSRIQEHFARELREHAEDNLTDERVLEEWDAYLSGEYGACLRRVSAQNIGRKADAMERIQALIDNPCQADENWARELRAAVDALDALERDFAPFDRVRWGPVSRDRLITAVRARYPEAFRGAKPSSTTSDKPSTSWTSAEDETALISPP